MNKYRNLLTFIIPYILIFSAIVIITACGNKAISVINENSVIGDRKCVIIDAGHGGIDGGATSCTGITESKLNLEIALRLADMMHLLGMETKEIRKTDISIHTAGETISAQKVSDLKNRVAIANSTPNAIVVSIHQNYYPVQRYSGAQVFYAPSTDSEQLATKLQSDLVEFLNPQSKRKAKKANGVYLMEHINCTGLLIECGFISNPEEERLLRSAEYQKKMCCIIAINMFAYLHCDSLT